MAKKTVASLQTEKNYVKLIKMVKNEKGNYKFTETMIKKDELK
jgi:hypothetical protein